MSIRAVVIGALLIELAGAIVVTYHAAQAFAAILRLQDSDKARLIIAEGVLAALGFMLAGTLLTMLALQTWEQIRTFAAILVLRTLLKRIFANEKMNILAQT